MAYLNQLLSCGDLAKLSEGDRDFLVQRIDHVLDTHPDIRQLVAKELEGSLGALKKGATLRKEALRTAAY